ncbi:hypothetical protein GGTG_10657 [Gaeumannomyces tritici R3-111a-1]|uniref:Uncharacterized protein n=1 Tax=Gaeumannomyces tritici (strain R3-111a-1) TaxID=644352 RepID=J3PAY2_GAET3|nr:hypothetical protein GGTG_10657 [Gaeumannomyces tritici R3-111a-1]EJT71398.1 hypothetical protein GGTG_10657 [Gaeumannomyces tritici R3-111a-1]
MLRRLGTRQPDTANHRADGWSPDDGPPCGRRVRPRALSFGRRGGQTWDDGGQGWADVGCWDRPKSAVERHECVAIDAWKWLARRWSLDPSGQGSHSSGTGLDYEAASLLPTTLLSSKSRSAPWPTRQPESHKFTSIPATPEANDGADDSDTDAEMADLADEVRLDRERQNLARRPCAR